MRRWYLKVVGRTDEFILNHAETEVETIDNTLRAAGLISIAVMQFVVHVILIPVYWGVVLPYAANKALLKKIGIL